MPRPLGYQKTPSPKDAPAGRRCRWRRNGDLRRCLQRALPGQRVCLLHQCGACVREKIDPPRRALQGTGNCYVHRNDPADEADYDHLAGPPSFYDRYGSEGSPGAAPPKAAPVVSS